MKLGDIRGERVLDVVADLVEPVANIAKDEAIGNAVRSAVGDGGTSTDALMAVIPMLLREHRADVVAILATISGVDPEDYVDGMTLASLIKDVTELLSDKEFASFLASSEETNG